MKSDRTRAKERAAANAKKMRLVATLTGTFDRATLLTLGFGDETIAPGTKEAKMRALIIRAKNRGCEKYIVAREYAKNGDLAAFRIFVDLDPEAGEDICKRWDLGPYDVRSVSTQDIELYQSGLFAANEIPKHRFLFVPSSGIWDKPKARAEA